MKMQKMGVAAGVLTLLVAAAGLAQAQVSSQGGPVMMGSDTASMNQTDRTSTLDGRVEIIQNDSRLRADHVVITYLPGQTANSMGPIDTITATGNIYYVTPDSTMKGDKAVYTKSNDTMVVTGDVILQQGQNVMTGNRLVSQVSAHITTLDANPTSSGPGRVHAVFYPDDNGKKGTAPAAKAAASSSASGK
ncbi:LptA/OstA family protein [Asticcacaulis sp. EMRT-3]|uniref:LptA/OstA family protein n=1 Tax=Asticcacaulis sp. EMRT-3 TaxID=3040349 RepID=UPI0024AEBCFD|nr:LptA/OstA family protein [Asticcacaulis sp. EMRT-3]MDI7775876.1 LptA/OstA family protein [Asticcacaulis sp. EMRT-3]